MQLAGLRGLVYDPTKLDLAKVVAPASDAALPIGADAHAIGKLADAATVRAWQDDGTLSRDGSRAVYRYHQVFASGGRTLTRKLLFAACKLAPWNEATIRAHEVVPVAARDAELARLRATGVQLQPLLGGYRDAAGEADRLMKRAEAERPIFEVTTADGTLHRVWRERRAEVLGSLRTLFAPKKITLLEGHARYDALLAYSEQLAAPATYAASNYALMALVALDDPTLQIRPRHRVIRMPAPSDPTAPPSGGASREGSLAVDRTAPPSGGASREGSLAVDRTAPPSGGASREGSLAVDRTAPPSGGASREGSLAVDPAAPPSGGASREGSLALDRTAVLAAARAYFVIEPLAGAARDAAKLTAALAETLMHQPGFVIAFAGDPDGYKLTLSPDITPADEGVKVHRAVQKLDPIVIDEMFLARALPGAKSTGELDVTAALAQLDAGASAVIVTRPLALDQITHVAELGQTLPAGSTAVWPAVAAGLVLHVMDRDEDLI